MPAEFRIRAGQWQDAERLQEIGVTGWETTYAEFIDTPNRQAYLTGPFWSIDQLRRVIADRCSDTLVVDVNGKAVGFLTIEPHAEGEVELTRLYVDPGFRGSGIGQALWERALTSLQTRGVSVVLVNVFGDNWSGRRFYERLGFVLTEETTTNVGTQTLYDVWYRMEL